MRILKSLLDFYINSSIHVGLSVYALTWITLNSFGVSYDENILYFNLYVGLADQSGHANGPGQCSVKHFYNKYPVEFTKIICHSQFGRRAPLRSSPNLWPLTKWHQTQLWSPSARIGLAADIVIEYYCPWINLVNGELDLRPLKLLRADFYTLASHSTAKRVTRKSA